MVLQKDSLMHSLYEIETTIKRSSRAKGLSWGVSEEAGKAVRVLEQAEFQGLPLGAPCGSLRPRGWT